MISFSLVTFWSIKNFANPNIREYSGHKKKLNVILKSYDPQVHCFTKPTFNDRGQCSTILAILPTVRATQDFGRDGGLPNHIPHNGKIFAERTYRITFANASLNSYIQPITHSLSSLGI